jgi:cobalt-zinc-cadmium efflux system membrane fusion protein
MKFQYIILIAISLFLFQCAEKSKNDTVENNPEISIGPGPADEQIITKDQFKMEGLGLCKFTESTFPQLIRTTGMIDVPPDNRAVISPHIGGYIKYSPYLVGDQVKKGDLLVSIENIEFLQLQQEYLEASEQLTYLKSEYERQEQLYEEKIASEKSFLLAHSNYKRNLAIVSVLEEKLKLLNISPKKVLQGELSSVSNIYSPINGDISEVEVSRGLYVGPSDHIMEIANTDHMHLELKIFEKEALMIKKGQIVNFKIPELTSENFKGTIHLIGKSIGQDRSIKVHAHIEDESAYNFIPGMYIQANIEIDSGSFLSLPEEAVIESEGDFYALQLISEDEEGYRYKRVKVITGRTYDGAVQILNKDDFKNKSVQFIRGGFSLLSDESSDAAD